MKEPASTLVFALAGTYILLALACAVMGDGFCIIVALAAGVLIGLGLWLRDKEEKGDA